MATLIFFPRPNFPQNSTCGLKRSEHHNQIQHTQIRLNLKFHLKQTILLFLDQIRLTVLEKHLNVKFWDD